MARDATVGRRLVDGMIAGAVGTCALDVTTYLDVAIRGRASSDVPAQSAGRLAKMLGVSLGARSPGTATDDTKKQIADHRRTGLGALLGSLDGISTGMLYGLSGLRLRAPLSSAAFGLAALVGGDAPAAVLGSTDPKEWRLSDWVSDLVPHLVYGFAAAYTYERLRSTAR